MATLPERQRHYHLGEARCLPSMRHPREATVKGSTDAHRCYLTNYLTSRNRWSTVTKPRPRTGLRPGRRSAVAAPLDIARACRRVAAPRMNSGGDRMRNWIAFSPPPPPPGLVAPPGEGELQSHRTNNLPPTASRTHTCRSLLASSSTSTCAPTLSRAISRSSRRGPDLGRGPRQGAACGAAGHLCRCARANLGRRGGAAPAAKRVNCRPSGGLLHVGAAGTSGGRSCRDASGPCSPLPFPGGRSISGGQSGGIATTQPTRPGVGHSPLVGVGQF